MNKRVCPWWIGYLLACPLRRWGQDPPKILAPYIREGMTVLEPGPGMGFFTIELLRRVGVSGRVVAVDLQPKMLGRLKKRAMKAGLANRLDARMAGPDSMGIADLTGEIDFTLAFAVVHEFPSAELFFRQVAEASKPAAQVLMAEPSGHVKAQEFEGEVAEAAKAGFIVVERPRIARSHAVILKRR